MHCCQPTLKPIWYCVFENATKNSRVIEKIEVNTKYTDNTDAPSIAENMDKIEADNRDNFISELDSQGISYNLEDVAL